MFDGSRHKIHFFQHQESFLMGFLKPVLTTTMKIYTKRGDAGETGLFGGSRVPKDDLRIRTYGTLDELNAVLGTVLTETGIPAEVQKSLIRVQGELFQLGAELATPRGKTVGIQKL